MRALALPVAALLLAGCSSSYVPAKSPRAQLIMQNGKQAIVRDGEVYELGAFGGGLEEAVAGNPDAEEHARDYQRGVVTGFACTLVAAAAIIGGGLTMALYANQHSGDISAPAAGLFLGGLALDVTGLVLIANAQPHFYDAINVYNDGLRRGVVRQAEDHSK